MLKTEIKFGIITGLGVSLWIIIEYLLGFHTTKMQIGSYTSFFAIIVPAVTIYFGLKEKRNNNHNNVISLSSGIKAGLMISLIAAVIIAAFLTIYFNYINPQYFKLGIEFYKEKLSLSSNVVNGNAEELESIKKMFSFINQLLFGVLGIIATGLIASASISYYFNKSK